MGKIGGILERYAAVGWMSDVFAGTLPVSSMPPSSVVTIAHLEPHETFTCIRRKWIALMRVFALICKLNLQT